MELNNKTDAMLREKLTDYLIALQTVCDILGLEGEWRYDPDSKRLMEVVATPPA